MSSHEKFDIFNDKMEKIGTATRHEAHARGLWHQTFQCWVIHTSGDKGNWRLLFQLRHPEKDVFPNLLDISCAGHLLAGEGVEDGVRELEEELGLQVPFSELLPCGMFAEEDIIANNLMDREFSHVFLYACNKALREYTFQTSEITGLFFVKYRDFVQLVEGSRSFVPAEGLAIDHPAKGMVEVKLEFQAADFVPHPRAYYELLFGKIESLSEG